MNSCLSKIKGLPLQSRDKTTASSIAPGIPGVTVNKKPHPGLVNKLDCHYTTAIGKTVSS